MLTAYSQTSNDNKNNTKLQRLPIRILVVTTLNNKKQNDNNSPVSINNGMNSNDDFNIYFLRLKGKSSVL